MDKLNKCHLKNLRSFQSLSYRTASCAVLLLFGALRFEAEIHKKQLTFLHNVLSGKNSAIRDLFWRQIILNMQNPSSFFYIIDSLLLSYQLLEITASKQCSPNKLSWTITVETSIREFRAKKNWYIAKIFFGSVKSKLLNLWIHSSILELSTFNYLGYTCKKRSCKSSPYN